VGQQQRRLEKPPQIAMPRQMKGLPQTAEARATRRPAACSHCRTAKKRSRQAREKPLDERAGSNSPPPYRSIDSPARQQVATLPATAIAGAAPKRAPAEMEKFVS
jgi:hypothetical protein